MNNAFKSLDLNKLNEMHAGDEMNYEITSLSIMKTEAKHIKIIKHFQNLAYLNLSRNFIKTPANLEIKNLFLLQTLDLSFNKIKQLNESSFSTMKNLLYLNLEHNNIKLIDDFSFSKLLSLEKLILREEQEIIQLKRYAFSNLTNLKILRLESKLENFLTNQDFMDLKSLKQTFFKERRYCCFFPEKKQTECHFLQNYILTCKTMVVFHEKMFLLIFSILVFLLIIFDIFLLISLKERIRLDKLILIISDILLSIYLFLMFYIFYNLNAEYENNFENLSNQNFIFCKIIKSLYNFLSTSCFFTNLYIYLNKFSSKFSQSQLKYFLFLFPFSVSNFVIFFDVFFEKV